jgi:hypothetical protein
MKMTLDILDDFIRGAAFLGTGGGGDPYVGRLMLKQELERGANIEIIDPDDVADDAFILPVANMGAPTVLVEKIPSGRSAVNTVRRTEEILGRKVDAVMPIEAGGINATLPLVVGAMTGLPVVDADGMGRAFPELQMTTFGVYGVKGSPCVIRDEHDNEVVIRCDKDSDAEWLARAVCIRMGVKCEIAVYPMSGHDLKTKGVLRTLTLSTEIGRSIREARETQSDPFEGLMNYLRHSGEKRFCKVLFDGKIVDLLRETTQGWAVGHVIMDGIGDYDGQMKVTFQNEFLAARKGDKILAMVPDLVCILDRETAEPITTEALKYGQRVRVVGVSVPPVMRTPEALAVFGPKYFGVSDTYTPIEDLA